MINLNKYLIVVDMQRDFITGSLANKDAQDIVENVCNKIKEFDGLIIATYDTHTTEYLNTQEGKYLPVEHCIKDTDGWRINSDVMNALCTKCFSTIHKPTFGYLGWKDHIINPSEIHVIGICTDICVISNVTILKAMFPETKIIVHANCCAGVTSESHKTALAAMKMMQVEVVENE